MCDKLSSYVLAGGHLVVAGTAIPLPSTRVFGVGVDVFNFSLPPRECRVVPAGTTVMVKFLDGSTTTVTEHHPVRVCATVHPADALPVATAVLGGVNVTLALRLRRGNGTMVVLASDGVAASAQVRVLPSPSPSTSPIPLRLPPPSTPPSPSPSTSLSPSIPLSPAPQQVPLPIPHVDNLIGSPLPTPFPMADHARVLLADVLSSQQPFDAGLAATYSDGLGLVATRVRKGEYLVGLSNNGLRQQNFKITTNLGRILNITETSLADAWMNPSNTQGYTATHTPPGTDLGHSTATTIAGLDFRVFEVRVDESNTQLIDAANAAPPSPPHPPRVGLPLPASRSLQEQLLLRPTFTQHFSSVVVDWRYIERTDVEVLAQEGAWLTRQNVRVMVDVTSGLNLYPDLRLCNNSARQYAESLRRIEAVITKCGTKVNMSSPSLSRSSSP